MNSTAYQNSFNPHTHEGCDATIVKGATTTKSFNPHTHEGCDYLYCERLAQGGVSIHTPTKGVTYFKGILDKLSYVSIHTPTKGVTEINVSLKIKPYVSIHTPTKGVTIKDEY